MGKVLALLAAVLSCAGSVSDVGGTTTTTSPGETTTVGATTTTIGGTTTAPDFPAETPPATHDTDVVRSEVDADEPLCRLDARMPEGVDPMADAAAADALLPLISVVNTYGVPLGQEFRGSGQSWNADGERIVVGSFVANVADHREALIDLVEDPDHLMVCRARLTVGEANAIVAEIEPSITGRASYSPGGLVGQVSVDLFAGNETIAESLHTTYGDQVDITLGVFRYPMPDPLPERMCRDLAPTSEDLVYAIEDLVYAIEDPAPIVVEPAPGFATEVPAPFVNATSNRIAFTTGYPTPYLVDPATGDVVGVPNAGTGVPEIGLIVDLEPGATFDESTWVPTASCDPALGHTLPPGDYDLYAVYNIGGDAVNVAAGDVAVGPVPITITEAQ